MSTIGKLIPDDDQAPGYCSSSKVRPLTSKQISRVMQAVNGNGSEVTGLTVFSEKTLVGKGTRKLCLLQEGDSKVTLVEYAGVRKAKFVSADAKRYEAMVQGAIDELGESCENMTVTKVVLMGPNGTICRRNTLTRLHGNDIIVMRCPDTDNDEEDDSGTSSE